MIYLSYGTPALAREYTAAFWRTLRESPKTLHVVSKVFRHSAPQNSLKMGVGVRNLLEKMSYNWKKFGGWVYFSAMQIFYHTFPGFFPDPPPGLHGNLSTYDAIFEIMNLSTCFEPPVYM